MALTEALGFEIETTLDYQEQKTPFSPFDAPAYMTKDRMYISDGPVLLITKGKEYTTRLINPIVDYTLISNANRALL